MIKSHKGAEKLVREFKNGDGTPTWEDRLKNQMGYNHMGDLATKVHGKGNKHGAEDARQLLSDLGVKSYTENDQAEAVQDRLDPEKNEPKGS
jgi:hypothetical protein